MVKMFIAALVFLLPLSVQAHGKSGYSKYDRCKPFNQKVRIDGKRERIKGYRCLQHDGSWEFISRDEYRNRHRTEHYDDDDGFTMRDSMFYPGLGFSIGSHGYYGFGNRHHHRKYSPFRSRGIFGHRWRGGEFLQFKRNKHKRKWKKRGGNSYSHLVRKPRKEKE